MQRKSNAHSRLYTRNLVNRQHSLNRQRYGWWFAAPHLSGGRQFYDLMGLTHGTLNGFTSMGWGPTTRPGGFGELELDGGSYVDCGSADPRYNFTTGNFTVGMSVRFSTIAGSPVLINRGTYQTSGWYVFVSSAGQVFLQCESAGVDASIATATGIAQTGVWQRLLLTRTGTTTGAIYLNGQAVSTTGSLGNCTSVSTPLQIGQYSGGSNRLGAKIDDVSIWGRGFTAQEAFEDNRLNRLGYPGVLNRSPYPLVTTGAAAQFITAAGIASAEAWGSPALSVGAVTISPYGIESSEAWGSPLLIPGGATIVPASIISAEQWGQAQFVPGSVVISPAGIQSGEQWGEPVFAPNGVAIFAAGIVSGERWGQPHVGTAHTTIVLLPTTVNLGNDGRTSLQLDSDGKTTVVLQ